MFENERVNTVSVMFEECSLGTAKTKFHQVDIFGREELFSSTAEMIESNVIHDTPKFSRP